MSPAGWLPLDLNGENPVQRTASPQSSLKASRSTRRAVRFRRGALLLLDPLQPDQLVTAENATPCRFGVRCEPAGWPCRASLCVAACWGGRRRTFAHVRSGRRGLTCEPVTTRTFREPSIWRTRVPSSSCGPTARMERSAPLLELAGGPAPCQISIPEPL